MNSRTLTVLVIVVIIVGGFLIYEFTRPYTSSSQKQPAEIMTERSSGQNMIVYNPEDPAKKAEIIDKSGEFTESGNISGTVTLGNSTVTLDDVMITTADYNFGGSGMFTYLVAFEKGQMVSDAILGDRIVLQGITVENTTITVRFLEHGPNQAMAENPTVAVTKTFRYTDHVLSAL